MALIHEMILVSKQNFEDFDFSKLKRNQLGKIIVDDSKIIDLLEVTDDLINYLADFLNWIPTSIDLNKKNSFGLNYHGVTYILNEDSELIGKLFNSLVNLFSIPQKKIKLTGEFCWQDENLGSGEYEVIVLDKEDTINIFKKVASWAKKMEDDCNLYIVHMGV